LGLVTTLTFTHGEYFQTSIISIIKKINELEPFYVATTIDCINLNQLKFHPTYIIFQDTCVERDKIKGVGKIVNKQSFLNTVLKNKTVFGQGNRTIVYWRWTVHQLKIVWCNFTRRWISWL
jgi:hypothetical protein